MTRSERLAPDLEAALNRTVATRAAYEQATADWEAAGAVYDAASRERTAASVAAEDARRALDELIAAEAIR